MRNGRLVVSEWLEALCSCSGATTHTSGERSRAISSNSLMPGDPIPSSLVTRMRALASSIRPSAMWFDGLLPSHIRPQYRRQRHGPVVALEVLENGNQGAPDRQTGAVEGMKRQRPLPFRRPVARLHAQGLECAAIRAAGNLAVGPLPRQPNLDIVSLLRGKPHIAV